MKTELWWASIGGNTCEPIRVVLEDNDGPPRGWFSIGCADEHTGLEGVELVTQIRDDDIPPTPAEKAAQEAAWQRAQEAARASRPRGYRRFD